MKTIIPLLLLFATSCIYTAPIPTPVYNTGYYYYQNPPQRDCQCGYVNDKGVDQYGTYFMNVQNQCSGNIKRFVFKKEEWLTFKISDPICMTQNSSW